MNPSPEQIAQSEAYAREAEAFVDAQWKAADAWLAAEWPHASDETRAAVRSAWTELGMRQQQAAPPAKFKHCAACTTRSPCERQRACINGVREGQKP